MKHVCSMGEYTLARVFDASSGHIYSIVSSLNMLRVQLMASTGESRVLIFCDSLFSLSSVVTSFYSPISLLKCAPGAFTRS